MSTLETAAIAALVGASGVLLWLWRRAETRAATHAQRAAGPAESAPEPEPGPAWLEAVLEGCGSGVIWVDRAGTVRRSNGFARRWLGLSDPADVGRPLVQATLSPELAQMVERALGGKLFEAGEIPPSRVGGRVLHVEVLALGPTQSPSGAVAIIHDLTDIRRLETVRRDFVANVSHELRTPLASIRAMAETLGDGALEDPEVSTRFLETIVSEADRLTRIAEDLLILTAAESRKPELAPIDLSALLETVVQRFEPRAAQVGITFESEVPPGLRAVSNADQMEQAIVNLVDNAIKYTPEGGHVALRAQEEGDSIAVQIADTGIGILQEDLPRVFERFYRVDKARSRKSGGTGLGLSIVKHIVESHGGRIEVQSELNRGSTFTITLRKPPQPTNFAEPTPDKQEETPG